MGNKLKDLLGEAGMEELKEEARHEYNQGRLEEQLPTTGFKVGDRVIDIKANRQGVVVRLLGTSLSFPIEVRWDGTEDYKACYTTDGRFWINDVPRLARIVQEQKPFKEGDLVVDTVCKDLKGLVGVVDFPLDGTEYFPLQVNWEKGIMTLYTADGRMYLDDKISLKRVEMVQPAPSTTREPYKSKFLTGDIVRSVVGYPVLGVVSFSEGAAPLVVTWEDGTQTSFDSDEPTLAKVRLPKTQEEAVPTTAIPTSSANNGGKTDYYSIPCKTTKLKAFLMEEYGYKDGLKDDSELLDSIVTTIKSFFPSTISDLIEYKKMSPNLHEIFKATYALEERAKLKNQGNKLRELNKILFFAEREKQRLLAEQEGDLYE